MAHIAKALIWALALLLVALGRRYGLVEAKMAQALLLLLPILAVLTLTGRRRRRQQDRPAERGA